MEESRVLLVASGGEGEPVARVLSDLGPAVTPAASADEALSAIGDVDCVVSEFHLPDSDGLELLSAVRRRDADLPFVLYTDATTDEMGERVVTADVTEYVRRDEPGHERTLREAVSRILSSSDGPGGIELDRYRTIVEAVGDPVYALDAEAKITYVNRATAELSGYDREELIGRQATAFMDEADFQRGQSLIGDLLSSNRRKGTFEMDLVTRSGERIPVENHMALLPYEEESRGVAGVLRDVTEHRNREQELQQYETIVECVPVGVYVLDAYGGFVSGNERGAELLGMNYDEAIDLSIPELIDRGVFPESVIEEYRDAVTELLSSDSDRDRATLEIEVEPEGTDETRIFETTIALRPFEDDFRGAIGIVRDVTDRRRRERELERYETILEAIGDPVYTLDEEGVVRYANEATIEKFGYPRTELIGSHVARAMDDADVERAVERIAEMMADPEVESVSLEYEMTARDGTRIPVENKLTLLPTADVGEFRGTAGVLRDITERRQRERRLQVLNRVLRHNIRNEMAIVGGYAEQLESQVPGDRGKRLAREIRDRANGIASMSDETRRLERAIDRDLEDVRPVDLVEYVEQVVEAYERTYPDARITTTLPDEAMVKADDPLRPAIANVIENAIVHNDNEEPRVRVSIRPDRNLPEERVVLRVADDGPGIPEQQRKLVLGEVDNSQLEHGNGFGLWVTTWIVESFGGTVRFQERDPRGTIVDLHLRRGKGGGPNGDDGKGDSTSATDGGTDVDP